MENELRELAQLAARDAGTWRRRFRWIAWFNIGYLMFFLPLALFFVTCDRLFTRVCAGVLFFFCGWSLQTCMQSFRSARNSFRNFMAIRQSLLQSLDQI